MLWPVGVPRRPADSVQPRKEPRFFMFRATPPVFFMFMFFHVQGDASGPECVEVRTLLSGVGPILVRTNTTPPCALLVISFVQPRKSLCALCMISSFEPREPPKRPRRSARCALGGDRGVQACFACSMFFYVQGDASGPECVEVRTMLSGVGPILVRTNTTPPCALLV